jgi:hypothetical protein
MNLVEDNIDAMRENTETFIYTSREVGVEINIQKGYCLITRM